MVIRLFCVCTTCFQLDSELLRGREHSWHVFAYLVDFTVPGGLYNRYLILKGRRYLIFCTGIADEVKFVISSDDLSRLYPQSQSQTPGRSIKVITREVKDLAEGQSHSELTG